MEEIVNIGLIFLLIFFVTCAFFGYVALRIMCWLIGAIIDFIKNLKL